MASTETPRRHAYTGSALQQPPEPSHAERVRTLVSRLCTGTLATLSRKHVGFPFGSLMPYALDMEGRPLFLISSMAMHTQNLLGDGRASLFVHQIPDDGDPLGAARATLMGTAEPVPEADVPEVRELYLAEHANSRYWVDFVDFRFFRLDVLDLYYVGGFGVMGWVAAEEYRMAAPDPLASSAAGIIAHMNADHANSLLLLLRQYAQVEASEASMTSVDRLGFTTRYKTSDGMKGTRVNFLREVADAGETRRVLIEMVRQAEAG